MVDAVADPVDEGLVAVVSVVEPAVLAVIDELPLPTVGTRVPEPAAEEVVAVVTAAESEEVVVGTEELELTETLVELRLEVLGTVAAAELLVLSPSIWKGNEYWKMLLSVSSSIFRP